MTNIVSVFRPKGGMWTFRIIIDGVTIYSDYGYSKFETAQKRAHEAYDILTK